MHFHPSVFMHIFNFHIKYPKIVKMKNQKILLMTSKITKVRKYKCFWQECNNFHSPPDAPEGGGKSSDCAGQITDELGIFGPMVSNPLPSANSTQAQVTHTHTLSSSAYHHRQAATLGVCGDICDVNTNTGMYTDTHPLRFVSKQTVMDSPFFF